MACVGPSSWWLHQLTSLSSCSPTSPTQPAARGSKAAPDTLTEPHVVTSRRLLHWAYGRVVSSASESFATRQRDAARERGRDGAVLELFEELADYWRDLHDVEEQRAQLDQLRRGARAQFAAVSACVLCVRLHPRVYTLAACN
jgi:hypothetical protein